MRGVGDNRVSNPIDVEAVQRALDNLDPSQNYLAVLKALAVIGVADNQQLEQATGLSRDQLYRLVKKLDQTVKDLIPAIDQPISRQGVRGRAPKVYRLSEAGAAILNAKTRTKARACELKDENAITHALGIFDLYLVARKQERKTQVDQNINYGNGKVLRPDVVVTLSDGTRAIFEIEQVATPDLLRRIVESLQHKLEFFNSASQDYSKAVRMLVALPHGDTFDKTIWVWQEALNVVQEKSQRALPFQVWVLSLSEFIEQPDWSNPISSPRWMELKPVIAKRASAKPSSKALATQNVPAELTQRSARDDLLVLKSLWLFFQESASNLGHTPLPDPAFFDVMRIIYAASHDTTLPVYAQASFPRESLFLLEQYLLIHLRLKERLIRVLKRGYGSGRTSVPTTLHRMQSVIDVFLEYHGWRSYGPLRAYASLVDFNANEPQGFGVTVEVAPGLLTSPANPFEQWGDPRMTEMALSWVLLALFRFAPHLGFDYPSFW
jgi:hypothetical protein